MIKVNLDKDIPAINPYLAIYAKVLAANCDDFGRQIIAIKPPRGISISKWVDAFNAEKHVYFGKKICLTAFEVDSGSIFKRNHIIVEHTQVNYVKMA